MKLLTVISSSRENIIVIFCNFNLMLNLKNLIVERLS